ncbi:MAG: Unknown protein [uncultured Sulfurovum sp.]|uniref:Uncharacterized protein n=1 Tax=uncultured Sulfurovum sp. TaxID=269237 RepID=A0A6S6SNV2_9BACT|nr:MAG: Unknown protein [uncultured Sulfurovum sp.]
MPFRTMGLTPERVYEVASATLHLKKIFETPLGRFSYRPIPRDWAIESREGDGVSAL